LTAVEPHLAEGGLTPSPGEASLSRVHGLTRFLVTILLALMIQLSLQGQPAKTAIQINDVDWTPFFMQGPRKGFAHEILQTFLDGAQQTHAFVLLPPPRTEAYMKTGELDLCVYSLKKEREAFLWFGREPIFAIEYRIAVREDSDLSITSLEDLEPYPIGRTRGIAYTPEITAFLDRPDVAQRTSLTKDLQAQVLMLVAGRIDAVIEASAAIGWEASENGVASRIKFVGPALSTKSYYLAVSKNSVNLSDGPKFLATFDAWLKRFKNTTRYAALARSYGLLPRHAPGTPP
jgi:polar amino acid transport system substrate-binding protein